MPQGFSVPPKGGAIAEPVDLKDADPERQKLYGKLAGMEGLAEDVEEVGETENKHTKTQPPGEIMAPRLLPSEEDKKEFLRAIMKGSRYSKKIVLFGSMDALFADRTTAITEEIFKELAKKELSVEDWTVESERRLLAAQLVSVGTEAFIHPADTYGKIEENLNKILKLTKPLYQALMEAVRDFEAHVAYLTQKAQDPDFWKPGGTGSTSTPTAPGK